MSGIITKIKSLINKKDPFIIEIGACEGEHTIEFLRTFPLSNVYCFEADPRNIEILNKKINNSRCQIFNYAVGNVDGYVNFYQSFGNRTGNREASGSIKEPKQHLTKHKWCKFNSGIKVPSVRLDTWSKRHIIDQKVLQLLWCDVNGAEKELIDGGRETLRRTKYFYTEFGQDEEEVYSGAITKSQIKDMLPDFKEIFVYNNNVLLENTKI